MSLHSNISPSAAKRWMACPGSVALCAKLPKSPSSKNAAEGTCAHGLGENLLRGEITKAQLMAMEGKTVKVDEFDIEVTEEMIDGVILYYDTVTEEIAELRKNGKAAAVVSEYEVKAVASSIDDHVYGTCDTRIYQKGNVLKVKDFKFGFGVVEVEENEQMMIYAISALDALKCDAFDSVELQIIQPRARHIDGPVRTWKTTVKALREFGGKLKAAVELTRTAEGQKTFESGPHCRWCDAKAHCPLNFGAIQKVTGADFTGVTSPAVGKSLPPVEGLAFDKMTAALDWEDAIDAFFKAARGRIMAELEAGRDVPGWKLVDGKEGNRKYTDEDAVEREFGAILGEGVYEPKKVLSPARLEKVVGKGKLDAFTFRPPGIKKMVRDHDPRPRSLPSVQSDFESVKAVKAVEAIEAKKDNELDGLL